MNRIARVLRRLAPTVSQVVAVTAVLIAAIFAYNLGAGTRGPSGPREGAAPAAERGETTVWTCSMHPQIREDEPGDCPICGMELVPVPSGPPAGTASPPSPAGREPAGYACAMRCVPPLPEPGPCPICGMEMVPVYDEPDTGPGGDAERRLVMSREARALAEIRTVPVERRWVENEVRMVGLIDYDETRLSYVTAYVGGRLDRLFVDYTGIPVRPGDHMVQLYSPELLTAQDDLMRAARAFRTLSGDALPAVRESARAALEAVRERLRLWGLAPGQIRGIEEEGRRQDHITILAPIGGTVIRKHLQEGAYVKTGDRIYTIADLSNVWMKLSAYESQIPWLRFGQDVTFVTEAFPGEEFHGRIAFIDPILESSTRTVSIRVNVGNEEGKLKPGMFVRAVVRSRLARGGRVIEPDLAGKWISPMHPEIVKDHPGQCDVCGMDLVPAEELGYVAAVEGEPPLVIPASAPLITGRRAVVYVEDPESERPAYEGREVVLGPRAGGHYLVVEGLREGERIVVNGAFKIDSSLQIVARRSMMNPDGAGAASAHDHGAVPQTGDPHADSGQPDEARDAPPAAASREFIERLGPVYAAALVVQEALADDDFAGGAGAFRDFHRTLRAFVAETASMPGAAAGDGAIAALLEAAMAGRLAGDLAAARAAFRDVSNALLALHRLYGHPGVAPLYRVHCPMAFENAGADWVQSGTEIRNPYFGARMPKCGVVKETLAPASPPGGGRH